MGSASSASTKHRRECALCGAQDKAHVRHKFYDIHVATDSPIAEEALHRIGELYDIEKEIMDSNFVSAGGTFADRLEQTPMIESGDPPEACRVRRLRESAMLLAGESARSCRGR